jgi:predicted regulator of Ras-like GTPase activity (Roadblock/LC7/MglB family)
MDQILRKIVESTPGAKGAILMGFDGISVAQWVKPEHEHETDIESMAMEFSFRFLELRDAATSLEMGTVTDITLKAEFGSVLVRVLSNEYFVTVLLTHSGHMGKGRWMLRQQADALRSDMAS